MAVLAQAWISIPEWFLKRVFCSLLSFAMAVSHVHGWLLSNMRVRHSQGWGMRICLPSGLDPQDWELVSEIVEDWWGLLLFFSAPPGRQWRRPSRQSIWRGWQPSALTHTHRETPHTHIYIYIHTSFLIQKTWRVSCSCSPGMAFLFSGS